MANSLEWTPMNLCVRFLHRVLDQTFGRIWDSFQISQIFSKFVVEILRKEYAFTVVHSNYNAHFELQFVTISLSLSLRCPRVPFHCLCGVFFQWACESMYFHVQIPCPLAFGCIEVHGSRTFVHDSFQTTHKNNNNDNDKKRDTGRLHFYVYNHCEFANAHLKWTQRERTKKVKKDQNRAHTQHTFGELDIYANPTHFTRDKRTHPSLHIICNAQQQTTKNDQRKN